MSAGAAGAMIITATATAQTTYAPPQSAYAQVAEAAQQRKKNNNSAGTNSCLTFSKAVRLAALTDPAISTRQARLSQAEADVQEAKSLFRPQISAFARTGVGDVGLIDSAIQNQAGLSVSQRILDFGDAKLAKRAARYSVDASEYDIQQAELAAGVDASAAMLDMLQAQGAMAFTGDRRQYFQDQLDAVEALLEGGGATVSERAEVAAQLASAQTFFLDLQSQFEQAETRLTIDIDQTPVICTAPILEAEFKTLGDELGSIDVAVNKAVYQAPELRALSARADSLDAQSKREKRARLPVISVVGSAAYSSIGSSDNFGIQERVGLDVSVPIFSGKALGARSKRARGRQAEARSELAERKRQLEEDVRIAYRRIASLEAQLITGQNFEDRSRELFEFAEFEYNAGTRTLPDLVEIRLEYEQAGLSKLRLKYQLLREKLRLYSLTGTLS